MSDRNIFTKVFSLSDKGGLKSLTSEFFKRISSEFTSYGLQRDLNENFIAPEAKIKISLRRLLPKDVDKLLGNGDEFSVDPRIIENQLGIIKSNIPTCYVAINENDEPCYMQWLIGQKDNGLIASHFNGAFPPLKDSEALLEGAYSNPKFRGLGIMPAAMARIAEKATTIDARWVNTFVDVDNIPSLKGCKRSGFKPYLIRKDRWLLFKRTITFHPLPKELAQKYYDITADKKYN